MTDAIVLERVFNFRDLGGLPVAGGGEVRRGVLFRSATPQQATPNDVEVLTGRGLRRILDLRFRKESESEGHGLFEQSAVSIVKLPFRVPRPDDAASAVPMQTPDALGPFYLSMLDLSGEPISTAVRLLLEDDGGVPALFHCAAGKDRTGVLAAILLGAVGVPDEVIVADYARSNEASAQIQAQLPTMAYYAQAYGNREPSKSVVDGGVMSVFMAGLNEKYGAAAGYLESVGISDSELGQLRELLVSH